VNISSKDARANGAVIRGMKPAAARTPTRRTMNGTEAAYAAHLGMRQLAGEIVGWKYEAVKLRLADGAFYKPDFLVILPSGAIELHETKGHWREAARVRFKVARELFAPIVFRAIRKGEGGFYEEQV
jgi:hypothetical protein